jgi:cytochrome c oxidase subunit 3
MDAAIAEQERIMASDWGGGKSPFGTTWGKFMMWVFIVSDALTFAGFIVAYGFMRSVAPAWPNQAEVFSMGLITFMTFALISSSLVMAMSVGAAQQGDKTKAVLFATIVGGTIFLGCQAYEWTHFIGEGASLTNNPFPAVDAATGASYFIPQFTAAFFVMTGFHGFHVFTGLVLLVYTALRAQLGRYSGDSVEIAGLYWHFIDVVWVFIFAFFYLL